MFYDRQEHGLCLNDKQIIPVKIETHILLFLTQMCSLLP